MAVQPSPDASFETFAARFDYIVTITRRTDGKAHTNVSLAKDLDLSNPYVLELRRGGRYPSLPVLVRIADYFDIDPAYFVARVDLARWLIDQYRFHGPGDFPITQSNEDHVALAGRARGDATVAIPADAAREIVDLLKNAHREVNLGEDDGDEDGVAKTPGR